MSGELYLAVRAPEFPAQALLRLRPELRAKPVVIFDGPAMQQTACSLNRAARSAGAVRGMTRLEAEAIAGIQCLARSIAEEEQARVALLECAARFSPRIEEASGEAECAYVLDIAGSERLFGPPAELAARLRRAAAKANLRISAAVSANYHAARMIAASTMRVSIVAPGEEARALEKLPLSLLGLDADAAATFVLWGIGSLGQLAALPKDDLVARMGAQAEHWHALASGAAKHNFQPIEPALSLREACAFESPVEEIDSLLFVAARLIDALVARAASRALALAVLRVAVRLENGKTHELALRPALPSIDRKFLLKLLQLETAAHPPQAAVAELLIEADAGLKSQMQLGLFAPQTPEPSRLDVTLARLRALVGEDRVGAAALEDTHRANRFEMRPLDTGATARARPAQKPRMALRRIRPPRPVQVLLRGEKLEAFRDSAGRYLISAAYGPWRSSGCWWSQEAWDDEEWDVLATDPGGALLACLLLRNRLRNQWRLEAFFD